MILGFIFGMITMFYLLCLCAWWKNPKDKYDSVSLIVITIFCALLIIAANQLFAWLGY